MTPCGGNLHLMPVVEMDKQIGAPVERVMEVARDLEAYPTFMPDVKSIQVNSREQDGDLVISEWVGRIPQFGLTVKWKQEDRWNRELRRVDFRQTEGDYDKMVGYWEFREKDGGTELHSYLEYEYDVPLLGALLKKVVLHIVTQNVSGMLDAIKRRSES
ncbi:MAG: hypothetical protein AKCLJLPJ_01887 [Fimbriimonadales bacterium]|nr:MAG: hypothetical protein EDM73_09465 [Armatimonadota bacterium]MBV6503793.1 hypothetical protein [Fimbriimonadales bacterium]MCE7899672.1 hypothetical protein [Armatimonadetes bacterium ATM1]MDL1927757.1 hypothetical protein [Fimbriimonadia bacterium ATM]MBC6970465.1 hypothetical protein [Armatimonadota bacterium]